MSYAVHRAAVRGQGPYMLWLFWGEEETEMPLPNLTSGPDGVFLEIEEVIPITWVIMNGVITIIERIKAHRLSLGQAGRWDHT